MWYCKVLWIVFEYGVDLWVDIIVVKYLFKCGMFWFWVIVSVFDFVYFVK